MITLVSLNGKHGVVGEVGVAAALHFLFLSLVLALLVVSFTSIFTKSALTYSAVVVSEDRVDTSFMSLKLL